MIATPPTGSKDTGKKESAVSVGPADRTCPSRASRKRQTPANAGLNAPFTASPKDDSPPRPRSRIKRPPKPPPRVRTRWPRRRKSRRRAPSKSAERARRPRRPKRDDTPVRQHRPTEVMGLDDKKADPELRADGVKAQTGTSALCHQPASRGDAAFFCGDCSSENRGSRDGSQCRSDGERANPGGRAGLCGPGRWADFDSSATAGAGDGYGPAARTRRTPGGHGRSGQKRHAPGNRAGPAGGGSEPPGRRDSGAQARRHRRRRDRRGEGSPWDPIRPVRTSAGGHGSRMAGPGRTARVRAGIISRPPIRPGRRKRRITPGVRRRRPRRGVRSGAPPGRIDMLL